MVSITTVAGSILCGICSSGCMRYIVYEGTVWQSRRVCGGEESCAHMTRHCMGSRATMFPVRVTVLVGAVPHSHVFRLIPFDHNILWCRAANAASVSMPPGHNCHLTNAANDEPANLERWIAPTRLQLIGINGFHPGQPLVPQRQHRPPVHGHDRLNRDSYDAAQQRRLQHGHDRPSRDDSHADQQRHAVATQASSRAPYSKRRIAGPLRM